MRQSRERDLIRWALLGILSTTTLFHLMAYVSRVPFGALIGTICTITAALAWAKACIANPSSSAPARSTAREPFDVGGALAFLIVVALYLPNLGSVPLWDPWETHYAEVAREILARNDWISLWWAQDHWFWSKPVLIFWLEAMSMSAFGVDPTADAHPEHVEWAIRLPALLCTLGALLAVHRTVRVCSTRRAAALSVLVLGAAPHFFFLSHQATTDLPLVAFITIACCALIYAWDLDEHVAAVWKIGPWKISSHQAALALLIGIVLPQALYLITRNIGWEGGLRWHFANDSILFGSAGNAEVPGNPAHDIREPVVSFGWAQPWVQGAMWLSILIGLSAWFREKRALRDHIMLTFYIACGVAVLAKGIPGVALPGLIALLLIVAKRGWSSLASGRLSVSLGVATVALTTLPWFVAMYIRHGTAFTNRLLIHDHINRLAAGVHGDSGTIVYFVEQLGYGLFFWSALIPLVFLLRDPRHREKSTLYTATWIWFFAAFVLFNAMITKYHHYIFPAVVPLCILIALGLDRALGDKHDLRGYIPLTIACAGLVFGISSLVGDVRGLIPNTALDAQTQDWVFRNHAPLFLSLIAIFSALLLLLWTGRRWRRQDASIDSQPVNAGPALLMGACIAAFIARDLSWVTTARPQGYERLAHLFSYNYNRAWPDHLDYRPILYGFAIVSITTLALASVRLLRPLMLRAALVQTLLFCGWGLHVYLPDIAPHWSSKPLIEVYYAERGSPDTPLVAWQMNWKGENFYTGNRVFAFKHVNNVEVKEWIKHNRGATVFFIFEHSRMSSFKKLMGTRPVETLTTKRDNNKFVLTRLVL